MNTTKESAADVAAVATKMADKMAAKQVAAEQAEAKQKTKMKKVKATKEEATKKVAEDAAPVEATKEEAAVHLARPHQCQWPIAWLGSAWKAAPPSPCGPCGHLRLWVVPCFQEEPHILAVAPLISSTQPTGKERRFKLPHARPHRRRRRFLRRLQPAYDEAQCGEQAGGDQPPGRVPAAVAAGAPRLQFPSRGQPRSPIR